MNARVGDSLESRGLIADFCSQLLDYFLHLLHCFGNQIMSLFHLSVPRKTLHFTGNRSLCLQWKTGNWLKASWNICACPGNKTYHFLYVTSNSLWSRALACEQQRANTQDYWALINISKLIYPIDISMPKSLDGREGVQFRDKFAINELQSHSLPILMQNTQLFPAYTGHSQSQDVLHSKSWQDFNNYRYPVH